jgi:hypothetical protein
MHWPADGGGGVAVTLQPGRERSYLVKKRRGPCQGKPVRRYCQESPRPDPGRAVGVIVVEVYGPAWSGSDTGRYAGRYPLAVETHASRQVDQLLPAVTSVTEHARFYNLHGLLGLEVARQNLVPVEAAALLRRCEVVVSAVSVVHGSQGGVRHDSFGAPHGGDAIRPMVNAGTVDVDTVSQPGRYSARDWGFWNPYVGSEVVLGLVGPTKTLTRGPRVSEKAVREGLDEVLALAAHESLDVATLSGSTDLCLCRAAVAADGRMLEWLLLPNQVVPSSRADRRSQSLRMLMMLVDLAETAKTVPDDLWPVLAFDEGVEGHDGLAQMDARHAWTGVVLRNQSVGAWRDLWSWLVAQLGPLSSVTGLGEQFADALTDKVGAVTVQAFKTSLPSLTRSDRSLAPAETDQSVEDLGQPGKYLALLFLGAARGATLTEKQAPYFEHPVDERGKQLTPTWMRDRIDEWADRPLADFAAWLVTTLVDRSQWVALRKARYERSSSTFKVPTRVFERDGGLLFKDSSEGGGQIALRWSNAMSIMAGIGLVERNPDRVWAVTDLGRAARDRVPAEVSTTAGAT